MADSPSTSDFLKLFSGFHVLKSPPTNAHSGENYWFKDDQKTLRESEFNSDWLSSPMAAWEKVRFRGWLANKLLAEIAKHKNDFVAIAEELEASKDVIAKDFTHDMKGLTDTILAALTSPTDGRPRSVLNALSIGISKFEDKDKKEDVFILGAGIRRRARFWKTQDVAIQADVEFFLPFLNIPNSEPSLRPDSGSTQPPDPTKPKPKTEHFRSINAGIALSYSDGSPLGKDDESGLELVAVRFNLRAPFGWSGDATDIETIVDKPKIQIQKKVRESTQHLPSKWFPFTGWRQFVESFCKTNDARELLNVPIGPLLLEKVDDSASVKDIVVKGDRIKRIQTELNDSYKEYKETMDLLDKFWKIKSSDTDGEAHSGQRKLGHFLESLGFMKAEKRPAPEEYKYEFKIEKDLTEWDVVDRILVELDGTPLYVKGTKPKTRNEKRAALALASQKSETDPNKLFFGLAGLVYNIALKTVPPDTPAKQDKDDDSVWIAVSKDNFKKDENIFLEEDDEDADQEAAPKPKPAEAPEGKSTVEVFLHFGKWFSDETIDDNWYKRLLPLPPAPERPRVPIPGIRLLPIRRTVEAKPAGAQVQPVGAQKANFGWTFRGDLLSFGIDIKSATKHGLTFAKSLADRFSLGALEIRVAVSIPPEVINKDKEWWEKFSIGVGVKLKDLRLSFAPKEKPPEKKDDGDEIMDGIENILSEEWLRELAPEKVKETKPKTRLSAKKKDKFSISFGYLTKLKKDSDGTLDVQLYDEKGNRGRLALIPLDRSAGPIYFRQIGIGVKGIENLELSGGLPDEAQLTVAITGGIRAKVFELGFINAKLIFQLNDPGPPSFELEGLDVSIKIGSVVVSGCFFKAGIEYAGMLTVDFPKASFSAVGFYGPLRVFYILLDKQIVAELEAGKVHEHLNLKLREKNITPAAQNPIKKGNGKNEWELYAIDNTRYTITDEDDKLNILRPEKTFFVYAMLNAASGCGPTFGPIQFTGIALGYGYNRRLIVPTIDKVADFPLVQLVMGEGGYQEEGTTIATQIAKPLEDPVEMLEDIGDYVVGEAGQQFACAGVRFTVGGLIDCFALVTVQWSDKDIELSMLGLARFRYPREIKAPAICYVELQMLMSLKPSEGTFQLQALLTTNSWIITKDCKLTGGFALFIWFAGPHKGDWVITFGGYHPRFVRPAHYPIVPRIGLNWRVNKNLTMKGSLYLAITPSCGMLGARLEAAFVSGRIKAWYTAYLDVLINWDPLYFEAEIGISLRAEVDLWIAPLKVTIGVEIQMWGPPVGGIAHIDLAVISFPISFGADKPAKPKPVETWEKFCHNFLNLNGTDTPATANEPVQAFPIVQPNLVSGRQNLNSIPNIRRDLPSTKRDDDLWKVRADELELAAATVVPVTTLNVGTVQTNSPPEGVQDRSVSGKPLMVTKPLAIQKKGLLRANTPPKLSVHPMGKGLESVLNVTVVRDDASDTSAINLTGWAMEEEISALPAALWDPGKPSIPPTEPSAKMIEGGITGLKKLKPPRGKLGSKVEVPQIKWGQLEVFAVDRSSASQEVPSGTGSRIIGRAIAENQEIQKDVAAALSLAGFTLTWQAELLGEIRFRELQANPLSGAVAAST